MCKKSKLGRNILRFTLEILGGVIILLAILCACAEKIAFQPPDYAGRPGDFQTIPANDGERIAILYFPPPNDTAPVFLYSHGNAEDLCTVRRNLMEFQRMGYGVMGYDYEGYGASTGKDTVKGACAAADAAYKHLTATLRIPPDRIVIAGYSIGSGLACYLAEKHPVRALYLLSPLASAYQAVLPGSSWIPGDFFPNDKRIRKIHCPVLILHGMKDQVIPFRNGKKVFENANEPKKFIEIPGAGHYDQIQILGDEKFRTLLKEWLR